MGRTRIRPDDIFRLIGASTWFNDELVNAWCAIFQDTSTPPSWINLNTFFFPHVVDQNANLYKWFNVGAYFSLVERYSDSWQGVPNIFIYDRLHIPINFANTHWAFAVINFEKTQVEFFDSLEEGAQERGKRVHKVCITQLMTSRVGGSFRPRIFCGFSHTCISAWSLTARKTLS